MNKTSCEKTHTARANGGEPEWLRVNEVKRLFGISKPKLYLLIHEGKVRSAALRGPKQVRGTRLISIASLRAHIEAMADEQAKEVRP
jgi:predicted DNA-binding transcriptional regulator AlpA